MTQDIKRVIISRIIVSLLVIFVAVLILLGIPRLIPKHVLALPIQEAESLKYEPIIKIDDSSIKRSLPIIVIFSALLIENLIILIKKKYDQPFIRIDLTIILLFCILTIILMLYGLLIFLAYAEFAMFLILFAFMILTILILDIAIISNKKIIKKEDTDLDYRNLALLMIPTMLECMAFIFIFVMPA